MDDVDETRTPDKAQYNMIVGTDLMSIMGLDIQFSSKKLCWEDVEIPMPKMTHYTTEVIVEIQDRHGETVPIRCLLDTGTSATIVLREYVAKGKNKGYKEPELTRWSTMGGVFTTRRKALLDFRFPEFSTNKTVEWMTSMRRGHQTKPSTT